jgi:hypothetical protein
MSEHVEKWTDYMNTRRGDFEFRSRTRYAAVAKALFASGLKDGDLIVDVGAGTCQFDHHLRTVEGWQGRYLGVDAVLDGTDLNVWQPMMKADFFVCIEVLEHLVNPERMMRLMTTYADKGVVCTTPNPDAVDVISCDPTHISVVPSQIFTDHGFVPMARSFFGVIDDTIVAVYRRTESELTHAASCGSL